MLIRSRPLTICAMLASIALLSIVWATVLNGPIIQPPICTIEYRTILNLLLMSTIYALLIAIPFVPGIEIGLLLMVSFGAPGIAAAYISTVIGLNLSFAAGRIVSALSSRSKIIRRYQQRIANNANQVRLHGFASSMVSSDKYLTSSILARIRAGLLQFFTRVLRSPCFKYRYISIGILLNMPGNWVLGGGGGIAVLSGSQNNIKWLAFFVTVVAATSILPALIYFGFLSFEILLNKII